jgi:hypothetical protein
MADKKWLCDVRSGCVAVYWSDEFYNCLSGIECADECAFYAHGSKHNSAYGGFWEMDPKDVEKAEWICQGLNDAGFVPEFEFEDEDGETVWIKGE